MLDPADRSPFKPRQSECRGPLGPGSERLPDAVMSRRALLIAFGIVSLATVVAAVVVTFTMVEPIYQASALLVTQALAMALGGAALLISASGSAGRAKPERADQQRNPHE